MNKLAVPTIPKASAAGDSDESPSRISSSKSPVPNQKWERFALALAAGASKTDAYLAAGYETTRESAASRSTKLAKEPWVRTRMRELLAARQRALHGWDAETADLETAPLENARWERFALHLAAGSKQTDAYLAAGYKADRTIAWSAAAQLAKKPDIRKRVEDLLRGRADELKRLNANRDASAGQPLKRAQWEVFAQDRAAGAALTDAFEAAGYKGGKRGGWSRGCAVAAREPVRKRVTELQEAQARRLADELQMSATELIDAAMQEGRFGPLAARTWRTLAKKLAR